MHPCGNSVQKVYKAKSDSIGNLIRSKWIPLRLLKATNEHALNYQDHRYNIMSIITDALKSLIKVKHGESESLQDFTGCFKTRSYMFTAHIGGPIDLTKHTLSNLDAIEKC
jgi:hypothetical protein